MKSCLGVVRAACLAFAAFLLSCTEAGITPPPEQLPPANRPASVDVLAGDGQRGAVGLSLESPLVVVVRNAAGQGVPSVPVTWTVGAGGGTLGSTSTQTDADGRAETQWTLGSTAGSHSVRASVPELPPVTITAVAEVDTVAPVLVYLVVDPAVVDVDSAAASITFAVTARDAIAGVNHLLVFLHDPSGAPGSSCVAGGPGGPAKREAVWACIAEIPRFAKPGEWAVSQITLYDAANNHRSYMSDTLRQFGFPTTFTVRSTDPDTTAPALLEFTFSPETVEVVTDSQRVEFIARLADVQTGVRAAQLAIAAPGGSPWRGCLTMARIDGDEHDGIWTCDVWIPAQTPASTWTVQRVTGWDHADNSKSFLFQELRDRGFPVEIEVRNPASDTIPPVLTGFSIAPDSVSVAEGAQRVTFTFSVADEGTGVGAVYATVNGPGPQQGVGCTSRTLTGGTGAAGTFECGITISEFSSPGEAIVAEVSVHDHAGNARVYRTEDLRDAGFAYRVIVTR